MTETADLSFAPVPSGGFSTEFIARLIARCGRIQELRPDSRVIVKPNFCYPTPRPGVTTSPSCLRAITAALREYTSRLTIVESDGPQHAWSAEEAFSKHGVLNLSTEFGATPLNLTSLPGKNFWVPVGAHEVMIEVPPMLLDADLFITVPVPKIHTMTTVSLGFKNQWGCLSGVRRHRHHYRFPEVVVALNKLINPGLAIVDGSYFLNFKGPLEGLAVPMGLSMAGALGFTEWACCTLMDIAPASVPYLHLAIQEGLMPSQRGAIPWLEVSRHRRPFVLRRSMTEWLATQVFNSRIAGRLFYDSALAGPLHEAMYWVRRQRPDYPPMW